MLCVFFDVWEHVCLAFALLEPHPAAKKLLFHMDQVGGYVNPSLASVFNVYVLS